MGNNSLWRVFSIDVVEDSNKGQKCQAKISWNLIFQEISNKELLSFVNRKVIYLGFCIRKITLAEVDKIDWNKEKIED